MEQHSVIVIGYLCLLASSLFALSVYYFLLWRSSLSDTRYWHGEAQKYWKNWRDALLINKNLHKRLDAAIDEDDADWWKKQ